MMIFQPITYDLRLSYVNLGRFAFLRSKKINASFIHQFRLNSLLYLFAWKNNCDTRPIRWTVYYSDSVRVSAQHMDLDYINRKLNLTFRKHPPLNVTRFSIWGRMFEAAVALVEAKVHQRLRFRLIQHSGWGTYYFEFTTMRVSSCSPLAKRGISQVWGR